MSVVATAVFGTGIVAAVPLAALNVLEAVVGVLLLRHLMPAERSFDTLHSTMLFIFSVGVVAPLATAPLGAGVVSMVTHTPFLENMLRWYAGHALGAVAFGPFFIMILRGDFAGWARSLTITRTMEAALIFGAVVATTIVAFAQSRLPLLFLPVLPMMMAIFRLRGVGATLSILTIIVVGGVATTNQSGPATLVAADLGSQLQFLQFYVAVLVIIALPILGDLSQRDGLVGRLTESEAQFRMLAEHSTDVILNLGNDGTVRFASNSIAALGGYLPEQVVGRPASAFVHVDDVAKVLMAFRQAYNDPAVSHRIEYRCLMADGAPVWVEAHVRALRTEEGTQNGIITVLRGTEERREREQRLAHQAVTDSLTSLFNRRGFFGAVDDWVRRAPEEPGCFALFDLDHFKQINDRYGHVVGDEVLVEFAQIIQSVIRENDIAGRIGGEEFGVLLRGATQTQASAVCERLRQRVATRLLRSSSGQTVQFTASAGVVAVTPEMCREQMYSLADAALYGAKADGRNRVRLAA